jgi:hypothetical protein
MDGTGNERGNLISYVLLIDSLFLNAFTMDYMLVFFKPKNRRKTLMQRMQLTL